MARAARLSRVGQFEQGRAAVQNLLAEHMAATAPLPPRSSPAAVVRDIQNLVRRSGNRSTRTPTISEILRRREASASPTPVVRRGLPAPSGPAHIEEDGDVEMLGDEEGFAAPSSAGSPSPPLNIGGAHPRRPGSPMVVPAPSGGGDGVDSPTVFSVADEARAALVLVAGGRRSLTEDFGNLGGSALRTAGAASPLRLASPDGVSGLSGRLQQAMSDRSSSAGSFHTALASPRSPRSPIPQPSPPLARRPVGSSAPLGHARRVSGLAPMGHVRQPSDGSSGRVLQAEYQALMAGRSEDGPGDLYWGSSTRTSRPRSYWPPGPGPSGPPAGGSGSNYRKLFEPDN